MGMKPKPKRKTLVEQAWAVKLYPNFRPYFALSGVRSIAAYEDKERAAEISRAYNERGDGNISTVVRVEIRELPRAKRKAKK